MSPATLTRQRRHFPLRVIQQRIREFWPEGDVERFLDGEDDAVKGIKEFAKKHQPEYHSAHRSKKHGGFKKVMDGVYPRLYNRLRAHVDETDLDAGKITEVLLRRYAAGEPISSTELKDSPNLDDRLLRRQVLALAEQGLFRRNASYTDVVSKITGLSKQDISIEKGARKQTATLTELMTQLVCTWAPILAIDLEDRLETDLVWGNGSRSAVRPKDSEQQEDTKGALHADLRVGSQVVEVKSGIGSFTPSYVQTVIDKYNPANNVWNSGDPISSSAVVFFMRPDNYASAINPLRAASIDVIEHSWITGKLRTVLERIRDAYPKVCSSASPRIHDLGYLARIAEEVATRPAVITREGNRAERELANQALRYLIEKGAELREHKPIEEVERKDLVNLVKGNVRESPHGPFLYISRNLEGMKAGKIGDYVKDYADNITLEAIRKVFPHLPSKVAKGKIGIIDIETRGLSASSPIISASVTYLDKDITTECYVARDPSEERAVLAYLLRTIKDLDVVATFNGTSFDLPRITHRLRQQGLFTNGDPTSVTEALGRRHIDLFHALRARNPRAHDWKLTTFEKLEAKAPRSYDIAGERIPPIYSDYVEGKDNAPSMARLIYHNMSDTVTGVGVLGFLCNGRKN